MRTFSEIATMVRVSSNISSIAITGSSGKTSLKEMLGQMMSKICQISYSKKSFNNKVKRGLSEVCNFRVTIR